MGTLTRKLWRRLNVPASREAGGNADRVISVEALMRDALGGEIRLPCLVSPDVETGAEHGIDFAAASVLERVALAVLVKQEAPRSIFEIGTFRGVTALVMASNAPEGSVLRTLDLPPDLTTDDVATRYYTSSPGSGFHQMAGAGADRRVGAVLRDYAGPCRIEQLYGDSQTMDFSAYYGGVDLFFVDGLHEYPAARRDTLTAWRCLQAGGLIVWHDYLWETVSRAVCDAELGVPITHVRSTTLAFARKGAER